MRYRSSLLSVLVACAALALATPAVAAPNADTLLRASGAALGVPNLHGARVLLISATGTLAQIPARAESWVSTGSAISATTTQAGPLSGAQGFDGRVVWQQDNKGVVWETEAFDSRASVISAAFSSGFALWLPGRGGATVSGPTTASDGGVRYPVLTVTPPGGVPYKLWFDPKTNLPERTVITVGGVTQTARLIDYERVRGVAFPHTIRTTSVGGGADSTFTTTGVAFDPPNAGAHLAKPATHPTDFTILGGKTQTVVPITLPDNHIALDVMLNGKGPYHFLLDTGGSNVLDPAVLAEVGGTAAGSVQGSGVGATTVESGFGQIRSLRVGDAELRDQTFSVLPVRQGFGLASSAPVDGLIGWEVLARYLTTIDYAGRTVTFALPQAAPISAPPNGTLLPFVFNGTQPEVTCTMNDVRGVCAVDTGSRSSIDIFSPFVATHPALVPANATADGLSGFGVGGGATSRLGRLQTLALGALTLPDVVADFDTAKKGAFAREHTASNIGSGVWKHFTMILDYAHQLIALAPNAAFVERDSYERAGVFAVNSKAGVTLVDVRAGTPAAESGLHAGDVIAQLNDVVHPSLAQVRDAFRAPAGTTVTLQVSGKGESTTHPVTLTLRDYV